MKLAKIVRYFKECKFLMIKDDVGVADISVVDVGVARFGKKCPVVVLYFFSLSVFTLDS